MAAEKKVRGRPRKYAETKLVAVRAPLRLAEAIEGGVSAVRMLTQTVHAPAALVLADALRLRLLALENINPKQVRSAVAALDRALAADFPDRE